MQQQEVYSSNTVAMSYVAKVPDLRHTMYEVVRMIEEIWQSYSKNWPSAEENKKKVYTTMRRLHDCLKPLLAYAVQVSSYNCEEFI